MLTMIWAWVELTRKRGLPRGAGAGPMKRRSSRPSTQLSTASRSEGGEGEEACTTTTTRALVVVRDQGEGGGSGDGGSMAKWVKSDHPTRESEMKGSCGLRGIGITTASAPWNTTVSS